MAFYRETPVKAVRKPRQCLGCRKIIKVGQPATDCAGQHEGDFWSGSFHPDCRDAEVALNELHRIHLYGEWNALSEIEWDDWPWLIEKFPTVAERMGITTERFDKINAEWQRLYGFRRAQA